MQGPCSRSSDTSGGGPCAPSFSEGQGYHTPTLLLCKVLVVSPILYVDRRLPPCVLSSLLLNFFFTIRENRGTLDRTRGMGR